MPLCERPLLVFLPKAVSPASRAALPLSLRFSPCRVTIGCASWNAAFCLEVQSRVAYGRKPKFGVAVQFRAGLDAGPVAVSACGEEKRQVEYFLAAFRWARGKASHRGPNFE